MTVNFELSRRFYSGIKVVVSSENPITRWMLAKICFRLLTTKLQLTHGQYS